MNRERLVIALLRAAAALPLSAAHAAGAAVGWLASVFPNRYREITRINLARCLPELAARDRKRLARRSLVETGKGLMELGPQWLWPGATVLDRIVSVEGESSWERALAEGQGAIAITPHLGAWEVAGLYLSSRCPLTTLYRPSRVGGALDELIRDARGRLGATLAATDPRGVRQLAQALHRGEALGILPDQDPGMGGGIFAPFFGLPAHTMVLLSRLAIRYRSPVFLLFAERLARGRGYRLHFEPLPEAVREEPLEASVAAMNLAIEQAIRRWPEQYLWSYKRFKRQPDGMPPVYPRRR